MKNLLIILALIVALMLVAKFVSKPHMPDSDSQKPEVTASVDLDNANIETVPMDETSTATDTKTEMSGTKPETTLTTTKTVTTKSMDETKTAPAGKKLDMITTATGLQYGIVTVGTGAVAKSGDTVSVHYTGTLTDGTKFDSSRDRGAPAEFPIGVGRLIKGWDEGIPGMKVGERRILVVPGNLAYGNNPPPGSPIKAGDTLVFDVELVGIVK